jgi:hypothetical protein
MARAQMHPASGSHSQGSSHPTTLNPISSNQMEQSLTKLVRHGFGVCGVRGKSTAMYSENLVCRLHGKWVEFNPLRRPIQEIQMGAPGYICVRDDLHDIYCITPARPQLRPVSPNPDVRRASYFTLAGTDIDLVFIAIAGAPETYRKNLKENGNLVFYKISQVKSNARFKNSFCVVVYDGKVYCRVSSKIGSWRHVPMVFQNGVHFQGQALQVAPSPISDHAIVVKGQFGQSSFTAVCSDWKTLPLTVTTTHAT